MAAGSGAFGAFGKIPALGDFFRFGMAPGFVAAWDDWLQRGILAGRDRLGEGWQDCYMTAPIWRFALAPGLAGGEAALGVMMPSVDRVGRLFPLTLATTLTEGVDPVATHFAAEACFHALETLALEALDDLPREGLAERLAAIAAPSAPVPGQVVMAPGRALVSDAGPEGGLPHLAAFCLGRDFRAPSVWSAQGEGGTRLMILEGMPDAAATVGLFDPNAAIWQKREAA